MTSAGPSWCPRDGTLIVTGGTCPLCRMTHSCPTHTTFQGEHGCPKCVGEKLRKVNVELLRRAADCLDPSKWYYAGQIAAHVRRWIPEVSDGAVRRALEDYYADAGLRRRRLRFCSVYARVDGQAS